METLLSTLQSNPHLHQSLAHLGISNNHLEHNTCTYSLNLFLPRATSLHTVEMRSTGVVWNLLKTGTPSILNLDLSDNKIPTKEGGGIEDLLVFLKGCENLQTLTLAKYVDYEQSALVTYALVSVASLEQTKLRSYWAQIRQWTKSRTWSLPEMILVMMVWLISARKCTSTRTCDICLWREISSWNPNHVLKRLRYALTCLT